MTTILICAFIVLCIVFWIAVAYACDQESNDFMHDYFGLPKEYDRPDEITVEIVKEKPTDPAQSSSSQTVTSALLSTTQAAASDDASSPKEKRVYLPE